MEAGSAVHPGGIARPSVLAHYEQPAAGDLKVVRRDAPVRTIGEDGARIL